MARKAKGLAAFLRCGAGSLFAASAFAVAVCVSAAFAQSEKPTIIHIKEDEKHDRLTPDFEADIEWLHELTVTISGKNEIHEHIQHTFLGSPDHPATARRMTRLSSNAERDVSLGPGGEKVVWRVLGPNKLRRIWEGKQVISIYDIDTDSAHNCHITRKVLLQKGFAYSIGRRAGTDQDEHFSLSRLVSITCPIE